MQSIEQIKEFINCNQQLHGHVRFACIRSNQHKLDDPRAAANALVAELGFTAIGELGWYALSLAQANDLAKNLLHQSLAYECELLPLKTAEHIANCLVAAPFFHEASFLTNRQPVPGSNYGWTTIGTATFEIALVGANGTHAFLLYAEDED